jgi:hypothetical protein
MGVLRTKSVGTKLTDDEYAALGALAEGQSMSEFAREVLLRAARQPTEAELVLAELLALRTVLANVLFAIANGRVLSEDDMRELIDRADQDKFQRAKERLASAAARRDP